MELTKNRCACVNQIFYSPDYVGNTHIFSRIIILLNGQDTCMSGITSMQLLKIPGILSKQDEPLGHCIGKVDGVRLACNSGIKRGNYFTTFLAK
jgi:hypothetical protein